MMRCIARHPSLSSIYRLHRPFVCYISSAKVLSTKKGTLERRLDALLRNTVIELDHDQQEEAVNIAKATLKQDMPWEEEASIMLKLREVKTLDVSFWKEYATKLDKSLVTSNKSRKKSGPSESTDDDPVYNRNINIHTLLRLSRLLVDKKLPSNVVADIFARWIKTNIYHLVPRQMSTFNGLLEYLSHVGHKGSLQPGDFDVLAECVEYIDSNHLVDALYFLAKLRIKNDAMITTVGRALHNEIAVGRLSPYQKTKIARAYAWFKHEHITFFRHIAEELNVIFEGKDGGKYLGVTHSNGKLYIEGIGSPDGAIPSGVMCNVLPYMVPMTESGDVTYPDKEAFKGVNEQIYTDGQIVSILDSMLFINLHHLEPYFKRLLKSTLKHCYVITSLEQFDTEQLRCAVTLLAQCRKRVDDHLLEMITRRFIQSYVDGHATNAQLALFLKDLVKQTKKVVKTVNPRNRIGFKAKFVPPVWLNNPLSEGDDIPGHRSQPSIIEACCSQICENVYSFDLTDLTSCIRSVAYLGFRNESMYRAFIPFFKDCMTKLTHVDIANITQALNKASISDPHLFYLMSKQHQLYLHGIDDAHKLYVKRIG